MKSIKPTDLFLAIALTACALVLGAWLIFRSSDGNWGGNEEGRRVARTFDPSETGAASSGEKAVSPDLSHALLDALREEIEQPHAWENEALLTFSDPAALAEFVTRATSAGLEVTGPFGGANTIRVSFGTLETLRDVIAGTKGEAPAVSANFSVGIPDLATAPPAGGTGTAPFGAGLLPSLGVADGLDRSSWGEGVTVAVIDSGIAPHPAFREGQITHLDLTTDGGALNAHGTAIASLVAGNVEGAEGLAPGADLLDIRIAGKEGLSDSYLLAQGIHAAIERGAGVINISMATYGDARPVAEAIVEAHRLGITVVAAVGNDAAGIKAWPAAYPGVLSVSGVDAEGHLAYFSNTGTPSLAAPSVGVPSAYHAEGEARLATGNGTSQATALVSGAAAAFRSHGLNAAEALIRNARPGAGKKQEIGAGVLFVPALGGDRGR